MTTTQRVRPLAAALMAVMALSAIIAPGASAETVGLQEWLSQTTDAYGVAGIVAQAGPCCGRPTTTETPSRMPARHISRSSRSL